MSEINIETLLKRAAMLEDEKDYAEALGIYNRILEADPDNEKAFERRRAIKNNTLTIVREQIPHLAILSAHYIIYVDGVAVDGSNFIGNTAPATFTVPVMLGKHRLSVKQVAYTRNVASEEEVVNYTFEMKEKEATIYLRYTKNSFLHFSELAQEVVDPKPARKPAGEKLTTAQGEAGINVTKEETVAAVKKVGKVAVSIPALIVNILFTLVMALAEFYTIKDLLSAPSAQLGIAAVCIGLATIISVPGFGRIMFHKKYGAAQRVLRWVIIFAILAIDLLIMALVF